MKITNIDIEVIHIPMKQTFRVSFAEINESTSVLVRISTDAGICGYGEAAPFGPVTGETVEQCLPYWDVEGTLWVRNHVKGIKVMVDESLHSPHDAFRICHAGAADVLNIKLMKCGGLYPALQINAIAEAAGATCMVGCMLETKIAITAGLSLVASRKNITDADCDSFLYSKDPEMGMPGGFTREGGLFTLSDRPGLGLDISCF